MVNDELKNNFIYISHLDKPPLRWWYLPMYPDSVSDSMQSTFTSTNALGRTAPVYTYSNSGPRTVTINLRFHRDMFDEINENSSFNAFKDANTEFDETGHKIWTDYSDGFIHALQSIAVPKFNLKAKTIEPPLVALRLGEEIFIKGVVTGGVTVNYEKPILSDNKYAIINIGLQIAEVDPYDSTSIFKNGSFRGATALMKNVNWNESFSSWEQ